MEHLKEIFATVLKDNLESDLTEKDILSLIEKPKISEQGDLAFPCFTLAKTFKKAPQLIASELANKLEHPLFDQVVANGPYVNVFLEKRQVSREIHEKVLQEKDAYGSYTIGEGKNIVFDTSSPNIAKPFSMGHLRSTVIGNSLALIVEKLGFNAIKVNHIGDWGTQFGKLIVAYKLWGDEEKLR